MDGLIHRPQSALRALAMFVRLWRLLPRDDRVAILAGWDELSPDERHRFGPVAGKALRRAMGSYRLALDTEDLEANWPDSRRPWRED